MEFHQIFINQLYIFEYRVQVILAQCSRSLYILFKNNTDTYGMNIAINEYCNHILFLLSLRNKEILKPLTLDQLFEINYDNIPYTTPGLFLLCYLNTGYSNYYPITINKNIDINHKFIRNGNSWKLSFNLSYGLSDKGEFVRNINFIASELTSLNYDFKYSIIDNNNRILLNNHDRLPHNLLYPFIPIGSYIHLILQIEAIPKENVTMNEHDIFLYNEPSGWISYDIGHLRDEERRLLLTSAHTKFEYRCCDDIHNIINCTNSKCSFMINNPIKKTYILCDTPEKKHNEYEKYQKIHNSIKKFAIKIDNYFNNSSYYARKLLIHNGIIISHNSAFFIHDIMVDINNSHHSYHKDIISLIYSNLYEK